MIKIPSIPLHKERPLSSFMNKKESFSLTYRGYRAFINEKECPVRQCRVSSMPFNQSWPGYQRPLNQSEEAGYITFSADEAVEIAVECAQKFDRAMIRPLSKNVSIRQENQTVYFTLTEAGGYVLELDDEHQPLHIFFNPIKTYTEKATYHFGPGLHFPGTIELFDNDSVYIDEEAIVFGSIWSKGAKNVHIYGGGVLNGIGEQRFLEHCYEPFTKGTLRLYNCENILIEDIILQDSACWVLALFDCKNAKISGIKEIGNWRYNTDGIDITNTSNVEIRNCFIRVFDDGITIKGIYGHDKPVENITIENCVLWCGWGRTCEIGLETDAPLFRNITFKNCDLIHNSKVAIDIQNGLGGEICKITFEDLRVEYQAGTQPEIIQKRIDQVYQPQGIGVPELIVAENKDWSNSGKFGAVHDIHYKNIRVYAESGVPAPGVKFCSRSEQVILKDFWIDGIYWNDKAVSLDFFKTTVENAMGIHENLK